MTPCEKAGYKVGDQFIMLTDKHFYYSQGDIVTLGRDDGTLCPVFLDADGKPWVCITLDKVRPIKEGRITLRPGDYVSTEGMTEDQYHAVARAFMAAGAGRNYSMPMRRKHNDYMMWSKTTGNVDAGPSLRPVPNGRHLTPAQVIGAVNAGKQQEEDNMTPCEKLGYEVGDRFVAKGASTFTDGSVIELYRDDGSQSPLFRLISGHTDHECADGNEGAFCNLARITPHTPEDTLTQTLRDADEHDTKAKHHSAEHDRLMQRARDMLSDGWRLVKSEDMVETLSVDANPFIKGMTEDMTDPANWRGGDIIRYDADDRLFLTAGSQYVVQSNNLDSDGDVEVLDDDGDTDFAETSNCTWVRRPT